MMIIIIIIIIYDQLALNLSSSAPFLKPHKEKKGGEFRGRPLQSPGQKENENHFITFFFLLSFQLIAFNLRAQIEETLCCRLNGQERSEIIELHESERSHQKFCWLRWRLRSLICAATAAALLRCGREQLSVWSLDLSLAKSARDPNSRL